MKLNPYLLVLRSIMSGLLIGCVISVTVNWVVGWAFFDKPVLPWQVRVVGPTPCPDFEQWLNDNVGGIWDYEVDWDHVVRIQNIGKNLGQANILYDGEPDVPQRFYIYVYIAPNMSCEDSKAIVLKETIGTYQALMWWMHHPEYVSIKSRNWTVLIDGLAAEYVLQIDPGFKFYDFLDDIFPKWNGRSIPNCKQLNGIHNASTVQKVIVDGGVSDLYAKCKN